MFFKRDYKQYRELGEQRKTDSAQTEKCTDLPIILFIHILLVILQMNMISRILVTTLTNHTKYDTIKMDFCNVRTKARYKPTETQCSMDTKTEV